MGSNCCNGRQKQEGKSQDSKSKASNNICQFQNFELAVNFYKFLVTEKIIDIKQKFQRISEIASQYAEKHDCCYLSPNYINEQFGLIEYDSPGDEYDLNTLDIKFWSELHELNDEVGLNENFNVIVLIGYQNDVKYFSIRKISNILDQQSCYIVFQTCDQDDQESFISVNAPILNWLNGKDLLCLSEEQLNTYICEIGNKFIQRNHLNNQKPFLRIIAFDQMDDKSESLSYMSNNEHSIEQQVRPTVDTIRTIEQ